MVGVNATAESGANLRAARVAAGLSQQALAERARCSMSMVRLLEAGYEPQSGNVLRRVRAVLTYAKRPAGEPGASTTSADGGGRDVGSA